MAVIFGKGAGSQKPVAGEAPPELFLDRFEKDGAAVQFQLRPDEKVFLDTLGAPEVLTYHNPKGMEVTFGRRPGEPDPDYILRVVQTQHRELLPQLVERLLNRGFGGVAAFLPPEDRHVLQALGQGRLVNELQTEQLWKAVKNTYDGPQFQDRAKEFGSTLTQFSIGVILERRNVKAVRALFRRVMAGGFDHLRQRQKREWVELAEPLALKQEQLDYFDDAEHTTRETRDRLLFEADQELDKYDAVIKKAQREHSLLTQPEIVAIFERMNQADHAMHVALDELEKKRRLAKLDETVLFERVYRVLRQLSFH